MKEIHESVCAFGTMHSADDPNRPWYHWLSSQNSNFIACIPPAALAKVKEIPYLTGNDGAPLSGQ